MPTDILLLGTGAFAGRIAFDLAATAKHPVRVVIAGRNLPRLEWLRTAANARAAIFNTPARFITRQADLVDQNAVLDLVGETAPSVVVQAASVQTSAVIATTNDGWSRLVAEGGLSATAVFQTVISAKVARAVRDAHPTAQMINCCFPDVVNGILVAMGLPVTCGTGNVSILANAFTGLLRASSDTMPDIKLLAHYQTIGAWRRPAPERQGPVPRVWLSETEIPDVFTRFQPVMLTPEPAIEISGAAGVPLILAIAAGHAWSGHAPGPHGLPGGYPVAWRDNALSLDLPSGVSHTEAVAWNGQFETAGGLVVDGTRAIYTGRLADRLHELGASSANGFDVSDIEQVYREMQVLKNRLQSGL